MMNQQQLANSQPTTHNAQLLLRLLIISSFAFVLFSCAPARKAVYFNNLQPGKDTVDTYIAELTKRVQYGDRILINIVTKDQEGNQLLNAGQGMGMGGGMGMNMQMGGGMMFGYLVDKKGNIELPVIGVLNVVNKAPAEIAELVREKVAKLYKDPVVYCNLTGRVLFLGDAGASGAVPITNERLTVIEALAQTGVIDPTAHRDRIWLIREMNGEREYVQLNLNDRDIFKSPYFYLRNNDVLYAPPGKLPSFLKVNAPYLSAFSIGTGLLGFVLSIIALTR